MKERGLINSIRKLFDKPLHNHPDWARKIEAEEAADWAEYFTVPAGVPSPETTGNHAASSRVTGAGSTPFREWRWKDRIPEHARRNERD